MSPENYFETDLYLNSNNIPVRKNIIEMMGINFKGKSLLDLGCGNGSLALQYYKDLSHITFVDLSSFMLSQLKFEITKKKSEKNHPEVNIINEDITKVNVDKKFDIIFAIGVLSYVCSLDEAFNVLKKHLAKDGHIILQYTNHTSPEVVLKKKLFRVKQPDYVANLTTDRVISRLIDKVDLKMEKRYIYPETSFRKMLPFNFVSNFKNFICNKSFLNRLFSEEILLLSNK